MWRDSKMKAKMFSNNNMDFYSDDNVIEFSLSDTALKDAVFQTIRNKMSAQEEIEYVNGEIKIIGLGITTNAKNSVIMVVNKKQP